MKSRIVGTLVALSLLAGVLAPSAASASTWYWNRTVVKTNAYPGGTTRFVWFSDNSVAQYCTSNPAVHYDEAGSGGKTVTAILMAALLSGRQVDIQIDNDGCTIVEVYFHNY